MTRHFWVLLHRYAGLYMAFFLTVAGLTGSVLAFFHELDGWLNPDYHQVSILAQPMLDDFTLRNRALALAPQADINMIGLKREQGQVYEGGLVPRIDPGTGKPYELAYQTIRLNPYTGELIGYGKDEGFWPLKRRNILGFIYTLHYSLALGEVGVWLFGIAALIWTVDCFVAFYLTFPIRKKALSANARIDPLIPTFSRRDREKEQNSGDRDDLGANRGFWSRWAIAWKIKWSASTFRLNFDLHRAGGLWTWLMLLVFAWSSVGFNLNTQIYYPVMATLFEMPDLANYPIANLPQPRTEPSIDWHSAYAIARRLMAEQAQTQGFQIQQEQAIAYQPEKGLFVYLVRSDRDISHEGGTTAVWFDGNSGEFVRLLMPTGQASGLTVTMWLSSLHMAGIWGLPYKIFVCLMGLVVAMLSMTGVYIWWKKRRAGHSVKARRDKAVELLNA